MGGGGAGIKILFLDKRTGMDTGVGLEVPATISCILSNISAFISTLNFHSFYFNYCFFLISVGLH